MSERRLAALLDATDERVLAVGVDGRWEPLGPWPANDAARVAAHAAALEAVAREVVRQSEPQSLRYPVDGVMHEAWLTPVDTREALARIRRAEATRPTSGHAPSLELPDARLAEVANRTQNMVVVTDLTGKIEWINAAFTRITGWTLDEVLGRTPGAVLQGPHTAPETRRTMGEALAARRPFVVEVLNYARDGRQYWSRVECQVALDVHGAPCGFVAINDDVTERRSAARREGLARRVAAILLESETLAGASAGVAHELVQELDVLAAQVWRVDPGRPALAYLAGAANPAAGAWGQEFLAASRSLPFHAGTARVVGVGIPGVAWGTARTAVLHEFARPGGDGLRSRRAQAALEAGISTFCAVPVLGPEGVLGVIEIGGTKHYPGHELLPPLLERVAEQVASFMLRDRTRRSFAAVFERSPDALLLVERGGRVTSVNARTRALFGSVEGAALDALFESPATGSEAAAAIVRRTARGLAGPFEAEITRAETPESPTHAEIVAVRDLTERHRIEQALTRSLEEQRTLLSEVHHRVKNNLQIVSSLLALQSRGLPDGAPRDALRDLENRVRAMALVHEQIYATPSLSRVNLGAYARALVQHLQSLLDPRASLQLAADAVEVAVDQAVPCGLLLNELVTNALKHGRSADGRCAITVSIAARDGGVALSVADAGPGIGPSAPRPGSLGFALVRSLTRQLRATLSVQGEAGTRVDVFFTLPAAAGG